MIEIVFSESAYGSLRVGVSYGTGKYHGGATSVFIRKEDGSEPTEDELEQARNRSEEKARRDWENAVPLGSSTKDLYCFDLALSIGEIAETEIGAQRQDALSMLNSIWPARSDAAGLEGKLAADRKNLQAVLNRCAAGESIRIWYSHNPDEMCGMYWLMAQLRSIKNRGSVYLVRLPEWECKDDNTICTYTGWGEIGPGEWGRYGKLQEEANPALFSVCATKWSQLKEENAPLRVYLNGQLQSASEDVYDSYILREIGKQPEVFVEAMVIGNVMGRYQLGIGDAWVALRIQKMIEEGNLMVVESASEGDIIYRQKLCKRGG